MSKQRGSTVLIYLVLAIAALGLVYLIFQWVDNHWETDAGVKKGSAEVQAKWDKAVEDQRERDAAKSADAATKLGANDEKAKVIYRTITKTVDKYIDRPIYRNMCFDADGLRDANSALVGKIAPPAKPDPTVLKPDPAR